MKKLMTICVLVLLLGSANLHGGSLVGWGYNYSGQASPPAGNDYIAIAADGGHSLALKSDGSIVGWGLDNFDQASPPAGNDYVTVAAGGWHSLALVCEPEPIERILDFIDESVADETLAPVKEGKPGQGQLGALINMIEAAGNLIEADLPVDACVQLHDALEKTDGLSPPESAPDFVAGEAAAELADMIEDLMTELGC